VTTFYEVIKVIPIRSLEEVGMMRRLALSLSFLFLTVLLSGGSAWGAVPQLGDVNDDGQVDVADAILALQTASRTDTSSKTVSLSNGDFNMDGKITLEEAIFILQVLAGLRDISFPVREATGKVVLPDGWPGTVPLATLVVHGELGTSAVGADGSFSVPLSGEGIALAAVTDAAGTPLMLGFLTDAPAQNILGAQSTAVALLFYTLGAYTLPPSAWPRMRSLIADATETATLAATIAAGLAADPETISKQNQTIADAIGATTQAIVANRTAISLPHAATTAAAVSVTRRAQSGDLTQVQIEEADPQSGARILLAKEGSGITARNAFRRHVMVLVYRTGWEDKDNKKHEIPWELAVKGPFEPIVKGAYLGATNSVGGVITSIIDWVNGSGAYAESSWEDYAIELPMYPGADPDTVVKTFYRVVCVGEGTGALPADLGAARGDLEHAYRVMQALQFFKEFFIPVFFALMPLSTEGEEPETDLPKDEISLALDIMGLVASFAPDALLNYSTGSYKNAFVALGKSLFSNSTFQERVIARIAKAGLTKACNAATVQGISKVAKKLQILLQIVDKVAAVFDVGMLIQQLGQSRSYEQWHTTAVWPQVRIQPNPVTVKPGEDVDLLVTVGGEAGNSSDYFYKFVWEVDGSRGMLTKDTLEYATRITISNLSPSAPVIYEAGIHAQQGDQDTVRVAAYRVNAKGEKKLGDAKATVTISGSQVTIEPATADVKPEASRVFTAKVKDADAVDGDVLVYQWLNTAQFGHMTGGQDDFESTTASSVTYKADANKEGVDSLSLSVYRERAGEERKLLGLALALVNVREPYGVQLTPQSKKLSPGGAQVYEATLLPELTDAELIYVWSNTASAGILMGPGGTNAFEQSENQATYTAGQGVGTDTVSVKVYRVVGGERFLLAEASTTVAVARYVISIPSTLAINWGTKLSITPTVTPSLPAGYSFTWTNTGNKGTLSDSSGQTGNFTTTLLSAYYTAMSDVSDGTDAVRVELYTTDGGTPVLQDSADCTVTVNGRLTLQTEIRSGWRQWDREDDWGLGIWKVVDGDIYLAWNNPDCGDTPSVKINTHGIDDEFLVGNRVLTSEYNGWQSLARQAISATLCQSQNPDPDQQFRCQLAPLPLGGVVLGGCGGSYATFGTETVESALAHIQEAIAWCSNRWAETYGHWEYQATCWKKQKIR
jgi:hypothetical protein